MDLKPRLLKGAAILGQLFRSDKDRCSSKTLWSIGECACEPKKKFCQARDLWIDLALTAGRFPEEGDLGMLFMMNAEEAAATDVTLELEAEGVGRYKVGPKGTLRFPDYAKLLKIPGELKNQLMVLRTFNGSTIQEVVEPAQKA